MKKMEKAFDFAELEKVENPIPFFQRTITISPKGEVVINKKFLECIVTEYGDYKIDLRHDEAYKFLAFQKGDENDFKLPSKGRMKHPELCARLLSYGYELPVRYIFEKNCEKNLWVGYMDEVAPAPSVCRIRAKETKNRRKAI